MPRTEVTLSINDRIIDSINRITERRGVSLTELIEGLLKTEIIASAEFPESITQQKIDFQASKRKEDDEVDEIPVTFTPGKRTYIHPDLQAISISGLPSGNTYDPRMDKILYYEARMRKYENLGYE